MTVGEAESTVAEMLDKILITMKEGEMAYIKTKMDQNGTMTTKSISNENLELKKSNVDNLLKFKVVKHNNVTIHHIDALLFPLGDG